MGMWMDITLGSAGGFIKGVPVGNEKPTIRPWDLSTQSSDQKQVMVASSEEHRASGLDNGVNGRLVKDR